MRRIIYQSHASASMTAEKTAAIIEKSRRKNATCGITGALVFADGKFLQILEGPDAAVAARFAAIRGDVRHHGLRLLSDGPVNSRSYPDSAMTQLMLDDLPRDARAALMALYALAAEPPRRSLRDMLPHFASQRAA